MDCLAGNATFRALEITTVILALNLLIVWSYSGVARGKTKTALNQEDAERFGAKLAESDPPEVARVLRAYANAQAAILPFLALAFTYVLAGGDSLSVKIICGVFATARVMHSVVYIAGKQPWRTLSFVVGVIATVAMAGFVVWNMFQSCSCPAMR